MPAGAACFGGLVVAWHRWAHLKAEAQPQCSHEFVIQEGDANVGGVSIQPSAALRPTLKLELRSIMFQALRALSPQMDPPLTLPLGHADPRKPVGLHRLRGWHAVRHSPHIDINRLFLKPSEAVGNVVGDSSLFPDIVRLHNGSIIKDR